MNPRYWQLKVKVNHNVPRLTCTTNAGERRLSSGRNSHYIANPRACHTTSLSVITFSVSTSDNRERYNITFSRVEPNLG